MRHFSVLCSFIVLAGILGSFFGAPPVAHAANAYEALLISVSGSGKITLAPGEKKEITATFQNIGTSTWKNDGAGYVSLYTQTPKYRKSVFDPGTWLWGDHLKRIRETSVAPGKTATVVFEIKAPTTTGDYVENFQLAAEDTAWVTGGMITLKISVQNTATAQVKSTTPVAVSDSTGYAAKLSVKSADSIRAQAGRPILFTVGFTNTGSKTWNSYKISAGDVAMASTSSFSHPSWQGTDLVTGAGAIPAGQMAVLSFSFTAPKTNGSHTARFTFTADGVEIPGAYVDIPIDVTGGAAEAITAPTNENAIDTTSFIEEPMIRSGVLIVDEETDNEVVITSSESAFDLRDVQGNLLAELGVGQSVTASYDGSRYVYDAGRGTEYSSYGLRFEPKTANAIMKISNFDRRVTRNYTYADNEFRNVLELRFNDYKDRTWVINELPMEYYLKGLAETSNSSPMEYQKALITAARTYAFYHWTHNTKRAKEFMTVLSTSDDQVYNGYGQEKRSPNIAAAVEATRGNIVTYAGDIAITPYFSRSAGKTYNWSDVWYGTVAWCVGVPVPWDEGKTLWGHGIGMSASGALAMAKEGYSWDGILKYFYTGIELEQRWQ
ncbi:MAG: SpoIID/LytB domain-containing protein [Patescibacteria group bacterium]